MIFKNITITTDLQLDDLSKLQNYYRGQITSILGEWTTFLPNVEKVIEDADKLLNLSIDNDPNTIIDDISDLLKMRYTVESYYCDAVSFVNLFKIVHYIPKRPNVTEADRELYINTKLLYQAMIADKLESKVEILKSRISVFQSVLKKQVAFDSKIVD